MSIDVHWTSLTEGEEGDELAERIRAFVHERFQRIVLPRMIRSVQVHSFAFGSAAPEIEITDVCDPLGDFYDDEEPASPTSPANQRSGTDGKSSIEVDAQKDAEPSRTSPGMKPPAAPLLLKKDHLGLSRSSTPGIPGGTSNMGYFHLPLSASLSGTATPFAAFGGPHGWLENQHSVWSSTESAATQKKDQASSNIPPSHIPDTPVDPTPLVQPRPETSSEDVQLVTHVRYAGDLKLTMTAEILLDYPMPSFVGIPLQLRIVGLRFDGVAILAHIKRKLHFCFLPPEDAAAVAGADAAKSDHFGTLFEEIFVESEIGQRDGKKQVLKNVGKVERFVLDQVRKIFETELVYPSYWTFLV